MRRSELSNATLAVHPEHRQIHTPPDWMEVATYARALCEPHACPLISGERLLFGASKAPTVLGLKGRSSFLRLVDRG
jgi:hypothetical protein